MDPNNKLLDDFLEMKLFHCAHCKNLLQTPVMLVEELGNVCHSCYDKIKSEENVVALENTTISTMLEKMKIPCENRSQGCSKMIQYEEIQQHKDQCYYQNFHCRAPDKCSWIGCLKDFLYHYRETHIECHFEYQNDIFFLDTSKEKLKKGVHLLNTSYGEFFLDVIKTDQDIRFFVFPMTNNIDDLKYTFSVAFVGEKGKEFSSTCQIVDWKSFVTASYDEYDNTAKVTLECLDYIFKNDNVVLIKVTLNVVDKFDTAVNTLLRGLECYHCKTYPKSKLFSSPSGNVVCATCVHKESSRHGQSVSENVALNKILENIRLPCRFANKGCRVKTLMNSKHNSLCYFKELQCLIPSCDFSGLYIALIKHILLHTSNCFIITSFKEIHSTSSTENYYLIFDNEVFHLSYKYTRTSVNNMYGEYSYKHSITWAVDIIGHTEQCYSYEIETNFKQVCMKFRAPCSYKGNEMPQDTYNQKQFAFGAVNLIKLPDDMFERASGNKCPDLKYTIKIFKD